MLKIAFENGFCYNTIKGWRLGEWTCILGTIG